MSYRPYSATSLSCLIVCTLGISTLPFAAHAQQPDPYLLINEIFFNPGGSGQDLRDEYVELRGTPGMSLKNHYLVLIENEDDLLGLGNSGEIEHIFDLNFKTTPTDPDRTLGTSGYLTMRQNGSLYPVDMGDGGVHHINTGPGAGWGNNLVHPMGTGLSSIGSSDQVKGSNPPLDGHMEGGGFTAWIVRDDTPDGPHPPLLDFDLDAGANGLDHLVFSGPNWVINDTTNDFVWTILDSVAFTEPGERPRGRFYAKANFGFESASVDFVPNDHIEASAGAAYEGLGFEVEYMGRWGNSTGSSLDDWHISNFTDRAAAGSAGVMAAGGPDWRQSCRPAVGCHPANDGNPSTPPPLGLLPESNQEVPYGTQLTKTLGRPNFITGDYNKDGYVDAADFTVWRDTLDQTGTDAADLAADANHDYLIGPVDYDIWKNRFGQPLSTGGSGSFAVGGVSEVPEPASGSALIVIALIGLLMGRVRRSFP